MASPSSQFESRCPAVGCSYTGRGATLSSARRAVRGHALSVHRARFASEFQPLQELSPEQLDAHVDAFRRGQMSAAVRRRHDQAFFDSLLGVPGGTGGSAPGSTPGLRAGSAPRLGTGPPLPCDSLRTCWLASPWLLEPLYGWPRLLFLLSSLRSCILAAMMPPAWQILCGRTPDVPGVYVDVADAGWNPVDPAAEYWMGVAAALQRALGVELKVLVQDRLSIGPSGRAAFDAAVALIDRWCRRPLDG